MNFGIYKDKCVLNIALKIKSIMCPCVNRSCNHFSKPIWGCEY